MPVKEHEYNLKKGNVLSALTQQFGYFAFKPIGFN